MESPAFRSLLLAPHLLGGRAGGSVGGGAWRSVGGWASGFLWPLAISLLLGSPSISLIRQAAGQAELRVLWSYHV